MPQPALNKKITSHTKKQEEARPEKMDILKNYDYFADVYKRKCRQHVKTDE